MAKKAFLKSHPEFEGLSRHSLKVAAYLLSAFPQWEGYTGVGEWGGERYFEMRIPDPLERNIGNILIISPERDIIVYVFGHHRHYMSLPSITYEKAFQRSASFIRAVLQEEIVIALKVRYSEADKRMSVWNGGGFLVDELKDVCYPAWTHLYSWLGTYDKILIPPDDVKS